MTLTNRPLGERTVALADICVDLRQRDGRGICVPSAWRYLRQFEKVDVSTSLLCVQNEFARKIHRVRQLVPAEREDDDKTHCCFRTPPCSSPSAARGTTSAQQRVVECVLHAGHIRVPSLDGNGANDW